MVIFVFWITAMLLCLAALALLLPPLLRLGAAGRRHREIERQLSDLKTRHEAGLVDAASYTQQRDVLSQRLIEAIETRGPAPASGLALTVALALPAAALALYFTVGQPRALDPGAVARAAAMPEGMPRDLDQAIAALEQRLRQKPDDIDGWLLLARTYRSLERFDDMLRATSSAYTLSPQTPDIMAEHAEALTLAGPSRRFGPEARQLLETALAADPQHQKSLWLLGVAELQAQRAPEAVAYWRRLRALIPDEDPVALSIDQQIANALAMNAGNGPMAGASSPVLPASPSNSAPASVDPAAPDEAAAGPRLAVTVELDPSLADDVKASDTLFVFVRAPTGGPPLAIRRIPEPLFPLRLTLGTADSMIDGLHMQEGAEVALTARISRAGQAQAQSGDLESEVRILTLAGENSASIQINRRVE